MKALTSLKSGANSYVLQHIYIYTVRALLDYCAVYLIMARGTLIDRLEKLQK